MASKYKAIKVNGKKHDLHRYLMEQHLGRKLGFDEVVHHKNGDRYDNRLANLEVLSRSAHTVEHFAGITLTVQARRILGAAAAPSLGDEQVLALREKRAAGATLKTLAAEYGISRQHAGRIAQGKRYSYVVPAGATAPPANR